MLPLQFFGQNLHFAISLFAAMVFFATFWLYFDAWTNKKKTKDLLKWLGFLLVSISFVIYATVIEQSVLGKAIFGNFSDGLSVLLRLAGYVLIALGLVTDPLQPKPKTKGIEEELSGAAKVPAVAASKVFGLVFGLPAGALAVSLLYWRRATAGLEHHLKPVAWAFLSLFGFELLSLAGLWRNTTNPNLYNLVKAFGPLWIAAHLLLLIGVLILGWWVWHYLTERFMSQLFMVFTGMTLAVFVITTISFTYLLMRNVRNDSLDNLATAANVLNYAFDGKKAQTTANAELVAQNPAVAAAVVSKDHNALASLNSDFLASKKQSSLIITSASGQVLYRAEDPSRWGDSISSDTLVRRALVGTSTSSLSSQEDVLAPVIYIKSTVPVRSGGNIVGTVSVALSANNALVDGIKNSTGLDSSIYSGNSLSATTFVAPDGTTRQIGVKQTDSSVNQQVLKQGQLYKGSLDIFNQPYLAVYAPLKDADNSVVGMLFVGQPQTALLETAGRSIELTFLIAAGLLVLSVAPAYLTARHLSRQLE